MPLPEGLPSSTLTFGPYPDATGAPTLGGLTGTIVPVDPRTHQPVRLVHVASGAVVIPSPITVTLDEAGTATVGPLPRQGTGQLSPDNFRYLVSWEVWEPSPGRRVVALPADSPDTVDFDLLEVTPSEPAVYVPVGVGPPGPAGPQGPPGPAGVTDHGALTGLEDDDHPQYLTDARGDVRYAQLNALAAYYTSSQSDQRYAGKTATEEALAERPTQAAGDARWVRDTDLAAQTAGHVADGSALDVALRAASETLVAEQIGDRGKPIGAAAGAAFLGVDALDVATFPGGRRVGFLGASVTNGSSSSGTPSFYQTVVANIAGTQKIRRWGESINGGVAGQTSTQIAARAQAVIDQGAELLLIGPDFGTNSAGSSVSLAQFQADVTTVASAARKANIPLAVCTTMPQGSARSAAIHTALRTYNIWLTLWAAAAGVPLIDTHGATVDAATGYLAAAYNSNDGVHPNDAGHLALSLAIAPALAKLVRDEPWPVRAPLPGFGMVSNPLISGTTGWSAIATGTGTVTAAAPVAGDGLPAGNWLSVAQDNTAGGSNVTTQRGTTLPSAQWSVGDNLLVCFHAKSTDVTGRGLKVQVLDQTTAARAVLLDAPKVNNPGPRMDVFTVPSGVTTLYLALSATVVPGANVTQSIGAADVYNLTRAGLDAYA